MVDAQPVVGAKHPLDPPDEEAERRAGVAGRVQVLARVEQRVVPRLPLRVGAAGRCAEQVVRQQEGAGEPGVRPGKADLQIPEQLEPDLAGKVPQGPVLSVEEKLGAGVGGKWLAVEGNELGPPGCGPLLLARQRRPQPPVEFRPGSGPILPAALAVHSAEERVEPIPHQPVRLVPLEAGERRGQFGLFPLRLYGAKSRPDLRLDPGKSLPGACLVDPAAVPSRPGQSRPGSLRRAAPARPARPGPGRAGCARTGWRRRATRSPARSCPGGRAARR